LAVAGKGIGRDGDAVVRVADIQGEHGQVQGGGAVGAGDGEWVAPDRGGEVRSKASTARAGGEEVRPQGFGDGGDVVVVDVLPTSRAGRARSSPRRDQSRFIASMVSRPSGRQPLVIRCRCA
jgi:hypothetical protein